jgi:multidrug/hemolysin transport system permease protein
MEVPMSKAFEGAPTDNIAEFEHSMGVTYSFGNYEVTATVSLLIIIVSMVVFFGLAVLNMRRKSK